MGLLGSIGAIVGGAGGFALGGPSGAMFGANLGGSLGGGMDANSASAASTKYQMDFQRYMSNTSYQRAVADLKKAGLNPALAYMNGGASTPSGSSYTAQDVATPALSSAQQAKSIDAQVKVAKETALREKSASNLNDEMSKKTSIDAKKSVSEDALNHALIRKADVDMRNSTASTASQVQLNHNLASQAHANASLSATSAKVQAAEALLRSLQVPAAKNNASIDKSVVGKYLNAVGRITDTVNPFVGALNSGKTLLRRGSSTFFTNSNGSASSVNHHYE